MVTGQPGIGASSKIFLSIRTHTSSGKRHCLAYLLFSRILKKKLTFYQSTDDHVYLFCERGIFTFEPTCLAIHEFYHIWNRGRNDFIKEQETILSINSSEIAEPLPQMFCGRNSNIFVVAVANPAMTRARGTWMKRSGTVLHFMKSWTWGEIVAGYVSSSCFFMPNVTSRLAQKYFARPSHGRLFLSSRGL